MPIFAARAEEHDKNGSFAHENVRDMIDNQLHTLLVPAEFGGMGQGLLCATHVLRLIAQGDASTSLGLAMHLHKTGQLAEQKSWQNNKLQQLWQEILSDGALINSAESEPEMGSPSRGGAHRTTAQPIKGGFVINGHKSWITYAPALRYFLISATFNDSEMDDEARIGTFAVRNDSPGLRILDNWGDALSLRASGSVDVILENVFVPEFWHVATRDITPDKSIPNLPTAWSTCCFAATYLGIGEAARHSICAYAKQRVPTALGKPISELPNIQRIIGQIDIQLRSAVALLDAVAHQWDTCPEKRMGMSADIAAAKYLCSNAAITATDLAMRAAGVNGLDRKLPLGRLLRDARAGLMHPPQDEMTLELLGKTILMATQ